MGLHLRHEMISWSVYWLIVMTQNFRALKQFLLFIGGVFSVIWSYCLYPYRHFLLLKIKHPIINFIEGRYQTRFKQIFCIYLVYQIFNLYLYIIITYLIIIIIILWEERSSQFFFWIFPKKIQSHMALITLMSRLIRK